MFNTSESKVDLLNHSETCFLSFGLALKQRSHVIVLHVGDVFGVFYPGHLYDLFRWVSGGE